jgi:hypothetical protein
VSSVGRIRITVVLCALCVAAAACTGSALSSTGQGVDIAEPGQNGRLRVPSASPSDPAQVGVDLVPLHIPAFIFGGPTSTPRIQPGSSTLVGSIASRKRLQVQALPSGLGTAAVHFLEISPPGHRWGEVMFPAERQVFREFASDPTLGSYLVMLTDVEVLRSPDPIPLTAYRWARADVETYARCGVPDRAIDACTSDFFATAQMSIINAAGAARGV